MSTVQSGNVVQWRNPRDSFLYQSGTWGHVWCTVQLQYPYPCTARILDLDTSSRLECPDVCPAHQIINVVHRVRMCVKLYVVVPCLMFWKVWCVKGEMEVTFSSLYQGEKNSSSKLEWWFYWVGPSTKELQWGHSGTTWKQREKCYACMVFGDAVIIVFS